MAPQEASLPALNLRCHCSANPCQVYRGRVLAVVPHEGAEILVAGARPGSQFVGRTVGIPVAGFPVSRRTSSSSVGLSSRF